MLPEPEFQTDFDLVWADYPRKTNKAAARKAWRKLAPDAATVQLMIDALKWQKVTPQWQRGVIPHFSTWLNQARWEDEGPGSPSRPVAPAPVVELARSIARQRVEDAEQARVEIDQRVQQLIGLGISEPSAVMQASQEWLKRQ